MRSQLCAGLVLSGLLVALSMTACGKHADYTITHNGLVSSADPAVKITLPQSAQTSGSNDWLLAKYSDFISMFPFVDADPDRNVERLYWIQFEAYSPEHPEYHHTYDSKRHVTLGGMDFLVDTWTESSAAKTEPDSDTAHLRGLLVAQSYVLPPSMMTVRFVHLMDGARKELMYIYSEPTPAGLTAADLKQGGKAFAQWPALEKGLIERGQKSISIEP
jgi:hypothetical protein